MPISNTIDARKKLCGVSFTKDNLSLELSCSQFQEAVRKS
jgi:hypothetical protein